MLLSFNRIIMTEMLYFSIDEKLVHLYDKKLFYSTKRNGTQTFSMISNNMFSYKGKHIFVKSVIAPYVISYGYSS